jgi:arginase
MNIDPKNVLRLNLPQWQGGDRPDYRLGAQVLAAIAPEPQGPVETIAVPRSAEDVRPVDGGIVSREALLDQLTAARSAIARHQPEAIVTLGGDCLVDLAPIAYLSERYGDDLAVLWVDAHPDVMGPAQFQNAHAHVLAILMGEGDSDFVAAVSRPLDPRRILYVGLTETTPFETGFIEKHGLAHVSPHELAASAEPVLAWLRATGAKRVAVHFDVDVLDPAHYDFLLFRNPVRRARCVRRRGQRTYALCPGLRDIECGCRRSGHRRIGNHRISALERDRVRQGAQHSPLTRQW